MNFYLDESLINVTYSTHFCKYGTEFIKMLDIEFF